MKQEILVATINSWKTSENGEGRRNPMKRGGLPSYAFVLLKTSAKPSTMPQAGRPRRGRESFCSKRLQGRLAERRQGVTIPSVSARTPPAVYKAAAPPRRGPFSKRAGTAAYCTGSAHGSAKEARAVSAVRANRMAFRQAESYQRPRAWSLRPFGVRSSPDDSGPQRFCDTG